MIRVLVTQFVFLGVGGKFLSKLPPDYVLPNNGALSTGKSG